MLLRVGLIMATLSVLLTAGVALMVTLRAAAPEAQHARTEPLSSETTQENRFDPGEKLEIDNGSGQGSPREEPKSSSEPAPRGEKPAPPPEEKPASSSQEKPAPGGRNLKSLPVSNDAGWTPPTSTELSQISQPRHFNTDPDATMSLTIEALGLYDVPVIDSWSEDVLSQGVMHVPDTAYPWDRSSQKNVFLAGHRVGLPGTDGRLLFFNLDELNSGDTIVLKDSSDNTYKYRVSDIFKVGPRDAWVADTLVGRDLLTLQTCTYPTFEERLVVRADRA